MRSVSHTIEEPARTFGDYNAVPASFHRDEATVLRELFVWRDPAQVGLN